MFAFVLVRALLWQVCVCLVCKTGSAHATESIRSPIQYVRVGRDPQSAPTCADCGLANSVYAYVTGEGCDYTYLGDVTDIYMCEHLCRNASKWQYCEMYNWGNDGSGGCYGNAGTCHLISNSGSQAFVPCEDLDPSGRCDAAHATARCRGRTRKCRTR